MSELPLPQLGLGIYALAALVIFFAAIVQSSFGMGFGQVAAPFLLLIDPTLVPVPILFMGMTVACLSAYRGRNDIVYKELGIALSGRMIGIFCAAEVMVIVLASPDFALVFAGLILFAVGISLVTKKFTPTPAALFVAGGLSGFMGSITSVGAPPLGLVYQSRAAAGVRATLNAFFGIGTILTLCVLGFYGLVKSEHVMLAIVLFPSLLLGTWSARFLFTYIDQQFRPLVLGICTTSALVIVYKALS